MQSSDVDNYTGGPKWRMWLRECCRQVEAKVESNNREKFHQTTCEPFAGVQYVEVKFNDSFAFNFTEDSGKPASRWDELEGRRVARRP